MKKKNLRFEKFSKLNDVEKMGIGFIICLFLMLGCITLYKTFAIYKEETTFDVIEGTVPDFIKKDKDLEIAIMVDGKSSIETPQEEYYYVTVECEKDEADTLSGEWDYTNKRVNMSGYITKPAVCTINFNSVFKSIIVDGEEKTQLPDKGDYQYNLTCENVTNSSFNEDTYKPVITGIKENSSCNIVFKSTNNIITKIIDANGNEVQSYPSKEEAGGAKVTCTPETVTGEWDRDNWKPIIKNITNETICEIEFSKELSNMVAVGDYIAYTPAYSENNGKYRIQNSLTGIDTTTTNSSTVTNIKTKGYQELDPSELNLWRVIKVNEDDTIEIVSEYASSTTVYFSGKDGYRKFVGSLNKIVREAYETEGITVASTEETNTSREIGYDGEQDECSAYDTCNDQKTSVSVESEEMRLIASNQVMGTRGATKPNGSSAYYWLSSRYHSSSGYHAGRYVGTKGNWDGHNIVSDDGFDNGNYAALRPIVTLRSGLSAAEGSKNSKKLWTIEQ